MTILNPHHLLLDGLELATVAVGLETVGGLDQTPDPRPSMYEIGYLHGADIRWDHFKRPRTQRLRTYISPYDEDGAVTHPNGIAGQRRANIETLLTILGKAYEPITVQKLIPHPVTPAATLTLESEAFASGVDVDGTQLRRADFTLTHPHPFWRLLPQIGPVAVPASVDVSDATAPITDMVYTFTGDGEVTHTNPAVGADRTIAIEGSGGATVVVDCGARTVKQGTADKIGWLRLSTGRWHEWEPGGTINLSTTGTVTVAYHLAKIT